MIFKLVHYPMQLGGAEGICSLLDAAPQDVGPQVVTNGVSRSRSSDALLPGVLVPSSTMVNRLLRSAIVQLIIMNGK